MRGHRLVVIATLSGGGVCCNEGVVGEVDPPALASVILGRNDVGDRDAVNLRFPVMSAIYSRGAVHAEKGESMVGEKVKKQGH